MSQFILVRDLSNGKHNFVKVDQSDDGYTDSLLNAQVFECETAAEKERIDDEYVGVLIKNPEGNIIGFTQVGEEEQS
ncbi:MULTISPECIES: hypothetical protein [Paenibacillus]|uniref:hypothetical protein n=1 Tax=Paenibacillus TaxID=44249 RepID=UPI0002FC02B3|nr:MULTISPECIES: hypothetical protein [Paenibacillus]KKD53935.1 hypothetical protein C400_15995 [Paenibacillus sp. ICGEB2008]